MRDVCSSIRVHTSKYKFRLLRQSSWGSCLLCCDGMAMPTGANCDST